MKEFSLNKKIEEKNDVYEIAHCVENAIYDYAMEKNLTIREFMNFVQWSVQEIGNEILSDLGVWKHMNEIKE